MNIQIIIILLAKKCANSQIIVCIKHALEYTLYTVHCECIAMVQPKVFTQPHSSHNLELTSKEKHITMALFFREKGFITNQSLHKILKWFYLNYLQAWVLSADITVTVALKLPAHHPCFSFTKLIAAHIKPCILASLCGYFPQLELAFTPI